MEAIARSVHRASATIQLVVMPSAVPQQQTRTLPFIHAIVAAAHAMMVSYVRWHLLSARVPQATIVTVMPHR